MFCAILSFALPYNLKREGNINQQQQQQKGFTHKGKVSTRRKVRKKNENTTNKIAHTKGEKKN